MMISGDKRVCDGTIDQVLNSPPEDIHLDGTYRRHTNHGVTLPLAPKGPAPSPLVGEYQHKLS